MLSTPLVGTMLASVTSKLLGGLPIKQLMYSLQKLEKIIEYGNALSLQSSAGEPLGPFRRVHC